MFENTNFVIKIVFVNTNCWLISKRQDRFNVCQSAHGHKLWSTYNFSKSIFTNSLKSLHFMVRRPIQW